MRRYQYLIYADVISEPVGPDIRDYSYNNLLHCAKPRILPHPLTCKHWPDAWVKVQIPKLLYNSNRNAEITSTSVRLGRFSGSVADYVAKRTELCARSELVWQTSSITCKNESNIVRLVNRSKFPFLLFFCVFFFLFKLTLFLAILSHLSSKLN